MVLDDTEWPSVREACRYFITNRGYRVSRCWGMPQPVRAPLARITISRMAKHWPAIGTRLKADWVVRDEDLGLTPGCRCVVLVKTADDRRQSFEHERF
jgi:hypothetical protein